MPWILRSGKTERLVDGRGAWALMNVFVLRSPFLRTINERTALALPSLPCHGEHFVAGLGLEAAFFEYPVHLMDDDADVPTVLSFRVPGFLGVY